MKVYTIHFKETTDDGSNVETGTFDYGYLDESKAIKEIDDTIEKKVAELEDDFEEELTPYKNETGDYQSITCPNGDTYEYSINMVVVIE